MYIFSKHFGKDLCNFIRFCAVFLSIKLLLKLVFRGIEDLDRGIELRLMKLL